MRIPNLKSAKVKNKLTTIEDFLYCAKEFQNIEIEKGKIKGACGLEKIKNFSSVNNGQKLFSVFGRLFVYRFGVLREIKNGVESVFYTSESEGELFVLPVRYNGEDAVFISEKEGKKSVVTSLGEVVVNLPDAEEYYTLGGTFYLAKNNTVFMGEEFSLSNFNNSITLPFEAGEIVGFSDENKKLFIVCERAVYMLSPFGEKYQYTIEKISKDNLAVKKGSVKKVGAKTVFISANDLCTLSGDKIEKLLKCAHGKEYSVLDSACVFENSYAIVLLDVERGNKFLLSYDFNSGGVTVVSDVFSCADGGYILSGEGVYRLNKNNSGDKMGSYKTLPLNFGNLKKKTLVEFSADAEFPFTVTFSSECGKKVFNVTEKTNVVKPNFTFRELTITLSGKNLVFNKADVKYRLKEES